MAVVDPVVVTGILRVALFSVQSVNSALETVHAAGIHHLLWQRVPDIDNSETEEVRSQTCVAISLLQLQSVTSGCDPCSDVAWQQLAIDSVDIVRVFVDLYHVPSDTSV